MEKTTVVVDDVFVQRTYNFGELNKDQYKEVVAQFLYYVSIVTPIEKISTLFKAVHENLFNFIGKIIERKENVNLESFSPNYYKQMVSMFELPTIEKDKLPWWGHVYWKFLHLSSFYTDKFNLHLQFNCVLMTLYLILPCPRCQENYEKLNPLKSLCIPIFKTKDATSMMYNLHNKVNLHKIEPSEFFNFADFIKLYNLTVLSDEQVYIKTTVMI